MFVSLSGSGRGSGHTGVVQHLRWRGTMPYTNVKDAWEPVQLKNELTVHGGYMRAPRVLEVAELEHGSSMLQFVSVGPTYGWICEMAAKNTVGRRPLSRVRIFDILRTKVLQGLDSDVSQPSFAEAPHDDKMSALSFDDGSPSSSSPSPPPKKKARVITKKLRGAVVRAITVSSSALAVAGTREVVAAVVGTRLFVQLDALSWLIHYVREELETGSVKAIEEPQSPTPGSKAPAACAVEQCIYWDFHNEAWISRSGRGGAKGRVRRSTALRHRVRAGGDLAHMSFQDAKQFVYNEFVESLALAEAEATPGDIADADGAGSDV